MRPEAAKECYVDLLRASGYRTGHYGKWHTKLSKGSKPQDHFDEFEDIGRDLYYESQPDGSVRHETEIIVDRGIEFVKSRPKNAFVCRGTDTNGTGSRLSLCKTSPLVQEVRRLGASQNLPAPRVSDLLMPACRMAEISHCVEKRS